MGTNGGGEVSVNRGHHFSNLYCLQEKLYCFPKKITALLVLICLLYALTTGVILL
jgi:K+-transporting ATPase A subunit